MKVPDVYDKETSIKIPKRLKKIRCTGQAQYTFVQLRKYLNHQDRSKLNHLDISDAKGPF